MTMWSLAMITKDASATLEAALTSVMPFCDELVVVDTGSSDGTVDLARSLGAKVSFFTWTHDFSAARNQSFLRSSGEWIFWMDADDVVADENVEHFLELKRFLAGKTEFDSVWTNVRTFDGAGERQQTWSKPRVVRRAAGILWNGVVHETLEVPTNRSTFWPSAWIDDYATALRPRTTRNLELLERAVANGDRTPNHLYSLANELRDHERFGMAVANYRDFLEVGHGWKRIDALMSLARCQQRLGSHNGARATLLRAVGEDPTRADGFIALGEMAYEQRQWKAAIPFFQAVIGMEQPSSGITVEGHYSWFPYDRLAICYGELGRFDQAIDATHQALVTCTEVSRLQANLAYFEQCRTAK
jgi:hypothetical protein